MDAARETSFRVLRCTTAPFLKMRRDSSMLCVRARQQKYIRAATVLPLSHDAGSTIESGRERH